MELPGLKPRLDADESVENVFRRSRNTGSVIFVAAAAIFAATVGYLLSSGRVEGLEPSLPALVLFSVFAAYCAWIAMKWTVNGQGRCYVTNKRLIVRMWADDTVSATANAGCTMLFASLIPKYINKSIPFADIYGAYTGSIATEMEGDSGINVTNTVQIRYREGSINLCHPQERNRMVRVINHKVQPAD